MTSQIAHAYYVCYHLIFAISNCASAKQCKTQQDPRLRFTWNRCILCRFLFRFCRGIVVQDWQAREEPFRVLSECKFRSMNSGSLLLSIDHCPGLSPPRISTQVDSDSSISSTVQVLSRYRWKCTDMWCEIFFRHSGGRGGWESAFSWEKVILLVMTWNYSLIRPDQILPSTSLAVVQLNNKFWLRMLQYFLPWGKGKKILQDREPKARLEVCFTAMLYCGTASRVSRVRCGWQGDGRCQNSSYHQRCQAHRRGRGKVWKSSKERIWKSSCQVIRVLCQDGFKMHWESYTSTVYTSKTVSPSFCRRLHPDGQQTLAAPPTTWQPCCGSSICFDLRWRCHPCMFDKACCFSLSLHMF